MKKSNLIALGITAGGIILGGFLPAKSLSQSVSGHITDLFTGEPVPQALVTVEDLGSGITDSTGFYVVGDSLKVAEFPYIITLGKTSKVHIFNLLGQKVMSLDNIVNGSRLDLGSVAKGIYIVRGYDEDGKVIGCSKVSNLNGNEIFLSVPDAIFDNCGDGGRRVNSLDNYSEVRINHPDYWERINYIPTPTGNSVYDEGLCSGDNLFLEHLNRTLIRSESWGSVRWPEDVDPIFKIWPHFIQNGQPVSQSEIDKIVQAIDSVAYYSEELFNGNITGQYEIVDSLPPSQTPGIVRVYYDSSIPFVAARGVSYSNQTHEAYYACVSFKFEGIPFLVFLKEIMGVVTPALADSDIIMPSMFNYSPIINYLTENDKKIIKANNSREPDWRSPDTNYP